MTSRWYIRGAAGAAVVFGFLAVLNVATGDRWSNVVAAGITAAIWAVVAVLTWRTADREAEAFAWHMFKAGIVAGLQKSEEVHHCEHEWSRYRDERTEAHGWRCTRCEAIRL